MLEITEATEVTPDLVEAMERLIPQLSSSNPPPDFEALSNITSSEASILLVAEIDGKIVGSLTLVLFRIPTGLRAWIEAVSYTHLRAHET